jgi:hypothetical protein
LKMPTENSSMVAKVKGEPSWGATTCRQAGMQRVVKGKRVHNSRRASSHSNTWAGGLAIIHVGHLTDQHGDTQHQQHQHDSMQPFHRHLLRRASRTQGSGHRRQPQAIQYTGHPIPYDSTWPLTPTLTPTCPNSLRPPPSQLISSLPTTHTHLCNEPQ